ncbi:hypothetical protein [Exiguobacterium artemiae]|uniref:hypothetical protein n=1 Tax=Exiguobacterium artemiae TaxID=340145 RepID=UPI0021C31E46|nr:hypothetical protein [Exiguobacterium artemiae]MCT4792854.1 hypothetical protein [Exiguobacterium artemiae]
MEVLKVEQRFRGQFWVSKPGQVSYAVGAAEAAEVLGYTIEEVRRLVVAVVENNTDAVA